MVNHKMLLPEIAHDHMIVALAVETGTLVDAPILNYIMKTTLSF